jgi:cell division protein ZapA (FtsZ GTPase activity inhibitor)
VKSVEIEILGKRYYLKTDEPETLLELAKILESQLKELDEKYKTAEQHKLFVLNSLRILKQLSETAERNRRLEKQLEQINTLLEQDITKEF